MNTHINEHTLNMLELDLKQYSNAFNDNRRTEIADKLEAARAAINYYLQEVEFESHRFDNAEAN